MIRRCQMWLRKRRYRRGPVPRSIWFMHDGKEMQGQPSCVRGFHIGVRCGVGTKLIGIGAALDPQEFLRAWYGLGGEPVSDEKGRLYDPGTV